MIDKEQIEQLNREIKFIIDYKNIPLNSKQRIYYLNKMQVDKINLLIPALIIFIQDKHCK